MQNECNFFAFYSPYERGFFYKKGGETILSEKETLFCRHYCNCLNPKESAIKAGYPAQKAEKIAEKLLSKKEISSLIKSLENKNQQDKIYNLFIIALKRMILYRSNDTIKLLTKATEISKEEIENLDLFNICEIKKLKDGSFEFKFIDRIKAIETLLAILDKTQNNLQINDFFKALTAKPAYEENDAI